VRREEQGGCALADALRRAGLAERESSSRALRNADGNISPLPDLGCPSRSAATNGRAALKLSPAAPGRL